MRATEQKKIRPDIWRADQLADASGRVVATGHAELDPQLPGQGWPLGALTELLLNDHGIGEWTLWMPALRQLSQAGEAIILIGAPDHPFEPALRAGGLRTDRLLLVNADRPADRLWAAEQALKSGHRGALLAWLPQARSDQLRRLQLAAQGSEALAFIVRPAQLQAESSPAPLRLLCKAQAKAEQRRLIIDIVKRRGPAVAQPIVLSLPQPGTRRPGTLDVSESPALPIAQADQALSR